MAPTKMPQLGESVTEGTVDRWLKKEGDFVNRGDQAAHRPTPEIRMPSAGG
ncbi:MAG TPA: lipoyl domain-containing protein [Candidatus Dormibacteraeota bacterium]|jgi:2-oxoisovalerate dehydrogenase E2 component (dihydrolipoyl transacylase)